MPYNGSNTSQGSPFMSPYPTANSLRSSFRPPHTIIFLLLPLHRPLNDKYTIRDACSEQHVCVCGQALFKRDEEEFGDFEACAGVEELTRYVCESSRVALCRWGCALGRFGLRRAMMRTRAMRNLCDDIRTHNDLVYSGQRR
jgi:hypothetical protein